MLPNIYNGDIRLLSIPPLILLALSLILIPSIKMGVDFQGGTLVTLLLNDSYDSETITSMLEKEGLDATVNVFNTSSGSKVEIEVAQSEKLVKAEQLKSEFNLLLPVVSQLEIESYNGNNLEEYATKKGELDNIAKQMFEITNRGSIKNSTNDLEREFQNSYSVLYSNYEASIINPINKIFKYESISVQTVSPLLSNKFIRTVIDTILFSGILSVILVFLFFRSIPPSIAVLTGAAADIIIALGAMGLFGIPLTLASFAALLMLIGFSLDTDILLTTRIIKRKGNPRENAFDAMKTGLTMSITGLIAFSSLFILSLITHIPTYYEISAVAICGLIADMFATWGINAVLVLQYKLKGDKE